MYGNVKRVSEDREGDKRKDMLLLSLSRGGHLDHNNSSSSIMMKREREHLFFAFTSTVLLVSNPFFSHFLVLYQVIERQWIDRVRAPRPVVAARDNDIILRRVVHLQ